MERRAFVPALKYPESNDLQLLPRICLSREYSEKKCASKTPSPRGSKVLEIARVSLVLTWINFATSSFLDPLFFLDTDSLLFPSLQEVILLREKKFWKCENYLVIKSDRVLATACPTKSLRIRYLLPGMCLAFSDTLYASKHAENTGTKEIRE